MGVHLRSGYAASKHAQTGFFDSLRIEIAEHEVSVTVAYPDFVATGGRARNLDKDGKPAGHVPPYGKHTMSSEACARIIIDAAAKRKRDVIMTTRGKIGQWARLVVPGLVDRIARRASEKGE
jgi:short-subunit dehydrogenase